MAGQRKSGRREAGAADEPPPTGRLGEVHRHLRRDLDDLSGIIIDSDLDLHLARLLALHPELEVRFHKNALAALDETTKRILLNDINEVLGILPLKRRET